MYWRTTGPWGSPNVVSQLSAAEIDANFWEVYSAILSLQDHAAEAAVGIAYVYQSGSNIVLVLTDHSQYTIALPSIRLTFKGAWAPTSAYLVNDIVTYNGSVYVVLLDHTSGSSFDPGANDGLGHNYYGLMLANPANSLPTGGNMNYVLVKHTSSDFDVMWADPVDLVYPPGGLSGQAIAKHSDTDFDIQWGATLLALTDVQQSPAPTTGETIFWNGVHWAFGAAASSVATLTDAVVGTLRQQDVLTYDTYLGYWVNEPKIPHRFMSSISHTMAIQDSMAFFECTSSACAWTIPPHSSVAFPDSTHFWFRQGSGPMTFIAGAGVTLSCPSGKQLESGGQGGVVHVWTSQASSDQWMIDGDLMDDAVPWTTTGDMSSTIYGINNGNLDTKLYTLTPGGNSTFTVSHHQKGKEMNLVITTSGTSSYTLTFGSGFRTTGTLATGTVDLAMFIIKFLDDGTTMNEIARTVAL